MPSITHEFLVDMFRGCPALSKEVLAGCLGFSLDQGAYLRLTAAELSEVVPPEYRADSVWRVEDSQGHCQEGWIIEVQLRPDEQKRLSWPFYVTGARARLHCPVTLVVIALRARVARWCEEPIVLDRAGNIYRPLVLGPAQIPAITDIEQAQALPELAVLSTAAHGTAEVAATALAACRMLDEERATRYADFIFASLGKEARRALEALMSTSNYQYQSDFAKSYVKQGLDEGLAQGQRKTLGKILRARFGELPADVVARLDAADSHTLDGYTERVMSASSLDEVFADPAP